MTIFYKPYPKCTYQNIQKCDGMPYQHVLVPKYKHMQRAVYSLHYKQASLLVTVMQCIGTYQITHQKQYHL